MRRGVDKPKISGDRALSFDRGARAPRRLAADEIARTNAVHAVAAIRLLAFTGCRRGEIATLKWAEVDLGRRFLNLPDSKTGKKTVRLSEPAVEILRTLPRIVGNRLSSPAAARDGQTARSTRHGRACASAPGSRTCGFTICGTLSRRLELRLPSACRSSASFSATSTRRRRRATRTWRTIRRVAQTTLSARRSPRPSDSGDAAFR